MINYIEQGKIESKIKLVYEIYRCDMTCTHLVLLFLKKKKILELLLPGNSMNKTVWTLFGWCKYYRFDFYIYNLGKIIMCSRKYFFPIIEIQSI